MIFLNDERDQFIAVSDNYQFQIWLFQGRVYTKKNDTDSVNVHQNKVVKKIYKKLNDFVKLKTCATPCPLEHFHLSIMAQLQEHVIFRFDSRLVPKHYISFSIFSITICQQCFCSSNWSGSTFFALPQLSYGMSHNGLVKIQLNNI